MPLVRGNPWHCLWSHLALKSIVSYTMSPCVLFLSASRSLDREVQGTCGGRGRIRRTGSMPQWRLLHLPTHLPPLTEVTRRNLFLETKLVIYPAPFPASLLKSESRHLSRRQKVLQPSGEQTRLRLEGRMKTCQLTPDPYVPQSGRVNEANGQVRSQTKFQACFAHTSLKVSLSDL